MSKDVVYRLGLGLLSPPEDQRLVVQYADAVAFSPVVVHSSSVAWVLPNQGAIDRTLSCIPAFETAAMPSQKYYPKCTLTWGRALKMTGLTAFASADKP